MQYSPKLKKAMEQIQSILMQNDIAAAIVLHTPGNGEFLLEISPSYSCATFNGDELRVRAKIKEDFNGDEKAWKMKVANTSNMLSILSENTTMLAMNLTKISAMLDQKVKAEHSDGGHTSHTTQNN